MAHRLSRAQWWMKLDHEATLTLTGVDISERSGVKAYALLHESGSLMHDERGPIVAASWPEICRQAQLNSAIWVLSMHERRAIRLAPGKNGMFVDSNNVLLVCDEAALASVTTELPQEIEREEAASKTRKRPSGAENRRR